jgi:pyruvate dehydrogenase E2 component (dihydrolipoyllysine-residue acetyltransferase)
VLQGVRMPALGQTSDELRIISWLKKEGDVVEQGEPLLEVETDKVTIEVEAFTGGILKKIMRQADEIVDAGSLIAYIGQAEDVLPDESTSPATPVSNQKQQQPTTSAPHFPVAPSSTTTPTVSDKPLASPPVRALMRRYDIDPREVHGTGPGGRIERRDVEALIQQYSLSPLDELEQEEK